MLGSFNPENEEHLKILATWQEKAKLKAKSRYKSMIKTWTIKDPRKRKVAKENNLKWIEFFTIDEFMKWYETI